MTRLKPTRAPKGATGACRDRRRPQGERRPAWVRPFERANRALRASARLINSSIIAAARSQRGAHRRPIRSSQDLLAVGARLVTASARLVRAAEEIAETNECIGREPERAGGAPELLIQTTERWVFTTQCLSTAAGEIFALHATVLHGLETGTLVPERPAERRPRIILAPRPVPVRAFLRARRRRATDRISPVLQRRRRTPRPAAVKVPRRTSQGRAPPLFSVCPH